MSALWLYVPPENLASGVVVLSAEESRHVHTRRLREGEAVKLFDGAGRSAEGRIVGRAKRGCEVEIGIPRRAEPAANPVVLATAVPKGDRLSTMLQMLTQLGATVWQPLLLEDSAIRKLDPAAGRIQRILIESCKVARRVWPLEVRPLARLDEVLGASTGEGLFYCDREGVHPGPEFRVPAGATFYIGPEAGFSATEFERLAAAKARSISLAADNLRIETAAVAAAALIAQFRSAPILAPVPAPGESVDEVEHHDE